MSQSPLQFAREFARFKSDLSRQPGPELRLLCLIEFWPNLKRLTDDIGRRTYVEEVTSLFHNLLTEQTLSDFSVEELSNLKRILFSFSNLKPGNSARIWIDQKLRLVSLRLATVLFYVGDIEKALPLCAELSGNGSIAVPYRDTLVGLDAYDSLKVLVETCRSINPALGEILKDIYERWEADKICVNHDRALCLFVEKDHAGRYARGRLKTLKGTVELRQISGRENDEVDTVTFDNQIKTPDDPFIGVAYDSLEAVKDILKKTGFNNKSDRSYRAYFSIDESQQTFTGDSIGLAMGLVSYTQLVKTEITRQQRFISNEVALTGGVDRDGKLHPVNKETLSLKVERAFFSPVKYIVVPEECYADAKRHVDKLAGIYPRRRLQLIGHSDLTDVIDDLNVVRSEKVCMSRYIIKTVVKYSRAAKIQIPILFALLYFIICLIFPKAWIGFDWNPQNVRKTNTGFIALNADSVQLWSKDFGCEMGSIWQVGDINDDGKNEIALIPATTAINENNANLFVYGSAGDLLFRRQCAILGEYPGDTSLQMHYSPIFIDFAKSCKNNLITTIVCRSYPARSHIKIWTPDGNLIGWYINSGFDRSPDLFSAEMEGRLILLSINNRMARTAIFALHPDSSYGVSPPYADPIYNLEDVKRGNQINYVLFPLSDVNKCAELPYNYPLSLTVESKDIIRADITEDFGEEDRPTNYLSYYFDKNLRIIDIKISDAFLVHRNTLVAEGKLPVIDWSSYLAQLRDKVTYWTDSGWVTDAELRALEGK